MTTHIRFDSYVDELSEPIEGPGGCLLVEGVVAKPGILRYKRADGSWRRELVTAETLSRTDDLVSLGRAPATIGHPPRMITDGNVRQYAHGDLGGDIVIGQNGHVRIQMALRSADAKAASKTKRALSPGYRVTRMDEKGGTHPEFGEYDAEQLGREYNHVCITEKGRGGEGVELRLDSDDVELLVSEPEEEIVADKKTRADGMDMPATFAQIEEAFARFKGELGEMMAPLMEAVQKIASAPPPPPPTSPAPPPTSPAPFAPPTDGSTPGAAAVPGGAPPASGDQVPQPGEGEPGAKTGAKTDGPPAPASGEAKPDGTPPPAEGAAPPAPASGEAKPDGTPPPAEGAAPVPPKPGAPPPPAAAAPPAPGASPPAAPPVPPDPNKVRKDSVLFRSRLDSLAAVLEIGYEGSDTAELARKIVNRVDPDLRLDSDDEWIVAAAALGREPKSFRPAVRTDSNQPPAEVKSVYGPQNQR